MSMSVPPGSASGHSMPPASQLTCRHCGGLCHAARVERYSPMVAAYGAGLLGVGYASLICMGGGLVVATIAHMNDAWKQASWVPKGLTPESLPILGLIFAGVVLGHFLAQRRNVWLCSVCGSLVERSDLPERAWVQRQKQR